MLGVGAGRQREQPGGHDLPQLGEPVHAVAVGLGDDTDRLPVGHHDNGAVRALGQQAERMAGRRVRAERQRGVVDKVPALHPGDHLGDDLDGDVLGQDGEAAPASHRLSHPAPGDRGHVGHQDGDRGAARSQVARLTSSREVTADRLGTRNTSL